MAITPQIKADVSRLYVSLFNRAPDTQGLAFWAGLLDQGTSLKDVANTMFATAPARAYYPAGGSSADIVTSFYVNVLGRQPDPEGLAFWSARLSAPNGSPGSLIVDMVGVVAGYSGADVAGISSAALFNNRAAVALYYADKSGALANATSVLVGVTGSSDLAAKYAAIDASVAPPPPAPAPAPVPQTFTLTAGADTFTGADGADVFVAGASTLNAGDILNGGGGTDVLSVSITGQTLAGTLTSIEEIRLVNGGTFNAGAASLGTVAFGHAAATDTGDVTLAINAGAATSFDLSGVTAGQAGAAGSAIKATYSNVGTTALNVTLTGLSDTFTGTANADIINAGGGDDTITMGVDGVNLVYDTIVAGIGNDTLVIRGFITTHPTISQNVIDLSATGDQLTKVNGVAEAVIQSGFENVSLHASRPNTGFGFTITAHAGGSKMAGSTEPDVINGGAGDDTIFGFMNQDKINGGGGTNTLVLINKLDADTLFTAANVVSNAATIANDGDLTNVQIITLSGDRVITLTLTGQTEAFTISASTRTGTGIDTTTIVAGSGNDTITGSSYVDFITGAQGSDSLTGGSGADEFNFGANGSVVGSAMDVITDFAAGSDKLKFSTTAVLRAADSSPLSTLNVNQSSGGRVTFHADSDTLAKKIAAVQADVELDVANSIAFFVDGANTYVYFAGSSSGDGDDQVVQLTGMTTLTTITAGASNTIA